MIVWVIPWSGCRVSPGWPASTPVRVSSMSCRYSVLPVRVQPEWQVVAGVDDVTDGQQFADRLGCLLVIPEDQRIAPLTSNRRVLDGVARDHGDPVTGRHGDRDRPGRMPGCRHDLDAREQAVPSATVRIRCSYRASRASIQSGEAKSLRCGRRRNAVRQDASRCRPSGRCRGSRCGPSARGCRRRYRCCPWSGRADAAQRPVRGAARRGRCRPGPLEYPLVVQSLDQGDRAERDGSLVRPSR